MIVQISADGKRHCDQRCYDAKWIGCNCICGGKNHGLGLQHALDELEKEQKENEQNSSAGSS